MKLLLLFILSGWLHCNLTFAAGVSLSTSHCHRFLEINPLTQEELELNHLVVQIWPQINSALTRTIEWRAFHKIAIETLLNFVLSPSNTVRDAQNLMKSSDLVEQATGQTQLEIIDLMEKPAELSNRYLEKLGAYLAENSDLRKIKSRGRLPKNPLGHGEYWDLASGDTSDAILRGGLEPGTHFKFFDQSAFVVGYLNRFMSIVGINNAEAIQADILKLKKPRNGISVLRTKNAVYYEPGLAKKLTEMAQWILPGGLLVIQADNGIQFKFIEESHGALIVDLLSKGWELNCDFYGKYKFESVILSSPWGLPKSLSRIQAEQKWQACVAEGQAYRAKKYPKESASISYSEP